MGGAAGHAGGDGRMQGGGAEGVTRSLYCHSERSEESEIVVCKPVSDFRFLASLEMTGTDCICEIVSSDMQFMYDFRNRDIITST